MEICANFRSTSPGQLFFFFFKYQKCGSGFQAVLLAGSRHRNSSPPSLWDLHCMIALIKLLALFR